MHLEVKNNKKFAHFFDNHDLFLFFKVHSLPDGLCNFLHPSQIDNDLTYVHFAALNGQNNPLIPIISTPLSLKKVFKTDFPNQPP